MKTLKAAILFSIFSMLFSACDKNTASPEEMLAAEIELSTSKVNIDPAQLPAAALLTIEDEYFDSYVETAAYVESKGYEAVMGNEDRLYFRENGEELRTRGNDPARRHGPCGYGRPVRPEQLPAAIIGYVADNYPGLEIMRAKRYVRGFVLQLSDRRLLIFNNALEFVAETRAFYFCDDIGNPIDVQNLPDAVTDYINAEFPGADILGARLLRGQIVVAIGTSGGRKILVFDIDGNFLFMRG